MLDMVANVDINAMAIMLHFCQARKECLLLFWSVCSCLSRPGL